VSAVLVVEDDPALLDAIADIVESTGHGVLRAEDGEEGLVVARKKKPALILSGYMMPKMDGMAFMQALKKDKQLRAVPFVLMSALPRPPELAESIPFVRKPFDVDAFIAVIKEQLAAR
jgi:CheY-like chemotaxis protein